MKGTFKPLFKACVLMALCFSFSYADAQSMRTYDVSSGLSANSIKDILQDRNGYIWCATSDGLNVFNGVTFKSYGCSYHPTSEDGISALNLLSILQHKDDRQIWAATQSSEVLLFNPETESFKSLDLSEKVSEISPNLCYSLTYDRNGNLWIGTDSGIFVYNEDKDSVHIWSSDNSSLKSNIIQCIFCDSNGVIWAGGESGLYRYNPAIEDFIAVKADPATYPEDGSLHIATISEGTGEYLWIGTWTNGLARLDRSSNILTWLSPENESHHNENMRIRNILVETSDMLWLCTNVGLFKYDIIHNRMSHVILSSLLPNDNIYSCMKDKEGGLWFGTYFKGIYYLSPKARQIECYTSNNVAERLHGTAISSFCEDNDGNIFIASENGGLSLFNPTEKVFIDSGIQTTDDNMHALCMDRDILYVGTFSNGLKQIDLNNGKIRNFTVDRYPELISDDIFSLYKGNDQKIYIGTSQGCAHYDPYVSRFTTIKELTGNFIYDITDDNEGNIWFACYYNGLFKYNRSEKSWKHYLNNPSDPTSLSHDKILSLYIDDRYNLWICTEGGGVCRYDSQSDSFKKLELSKDGHDVTLKTVYGILNDASGRLWLSSNNGIWICDSEGNIIHHMTHEDGLQSNQYNFGATFRASSGKLFFGGIEGFNVFNAESIRNSETLPTVTACISYRDPDGKTIYSGKETGTAEIKLPRDVSSFSMDFECLSFIAPHKNKFAYILDDQTDTTYTSESSVTFLNFPYGKHTIVVRACNGDGYWSENETILNINNQPPVFKSIGAKILYTLILLTALIIAGLALEKRRNEKSRLKFKEIKAIQDQEAYTAKINFFTHVAHEIKTPVTLIKAPLEVVLKNEKNDDNRRNLDIIEKNTKRLLSLVNQLLDFKKISSTGHDISIEASNPAILVNEVTNRFDGATLGDIIIETHIADEGLQCMLDPEAYTKIISNLMTNAVKHTRSRIDISLDLHEDANGKMLHLEVKDDGCGIPEEEQANIFDTFYQINTEENPRMSGVGLGLSLVKLLVQKHNGQVYIDNNYQNGCCICIDIPYIAVQNATKAESNDNEVRNDESDTSSAGTYSLNLLIVEDTSDMLEFISSVFKEKHTIFKAPNGQEALNILGNNDIDLIITDISMPLMNGFELLKRIRKNELFCHIPVIMLTVENSLETRIKGLEYGADAYIEKPFSTHHLQATVDNLINRRETMRKRYLGNPLKQEADSIVSDRDQKWFAHVTELIQNNIHEPEISIDTLASDLNLSRSSFQRKIKGLTGLSPIEFIRLIRLKKAAELLSTGNYRVNEVSYMVGFNKASYFSSLFKKQFGVLPKDFISKDA